MKNKELLAIAVGIFLTIVAWMVVDVYHIQKNSKANIEVKPANLTPLGDFKKIIDTLNKKNVLQ